MKYALSDDTWDEKELSVVHRVLDSKMYTMGSHVKTFEGQFAKNGKQICCHVKFRILC